MGSRILLRSFIAEERGTETVEWGLMVGLIVGGLVLVLAAIGVRVSTRMENLHGELSIGTP